MSWARTPQLDFGAGLADAEGHYEDTAPEDDQAAAAAAQAQDAPGANPPAPSAVWQ